LAFLGRGQSGDEIDKNRVEVVAADELVRRRADGISLKRMWNELETDYLLGYFRRATDL